MEEKEEVKWKKDTLGVGGRRERDRDRGGGRDKYYR